MNDHLLMVCDLDDTLAYTKEAVFSAYEEAFGTRPTETMWGMPWQTWCPPATKKIKDRVYPSWLRTRAHMTDFGRAVDWERILILTGASRSGVRAVTDRFFPSGINLSVIGYSRSIEMKHDILAAMRPQVYGRDHAAFYFDDEEIAGKKIVLNTGFTFAHVAHDGVLIHGNEEGDSSWIPSSSLRELTSALRDWSRRTTSHS